MHGSKNPTRIQNQFLTPRLEQKKTRFVGSVQGGPRKKQVISGVTPIIYRFFFHPSEAQENFLAINQGFKKTRLIRIAGAHGPYMTYFPYWFPPNPTTHSQVVPRFLESQVCQLPFFPSHGPTGIPLELVYLPTKKKTTYNTYTVYQHLQIGVPNGS